MPASYKIPGLEQLKKEAEAKMREEQRLKKQKLKSLGIEDDDSLTSISDDEDYGQQHSDGDHSEGQNELY